MNAVKEVRLIRPIEVHWSGVAMPHITLRNPEKVMYDPVTRMLHVDTGRDLVLLPVDAESVDRMILERALPGAGNPDPSSSKASASPSAASTEPVAKGVLRRTR